MKVIDVVLSNHKNEISRPSPSLKQTQLAVPGNPGGPAIPVDDVQGADRNREDHVSTGSLAGSIASASSGFGSLPKKRPTIFSSGNSQYLFFIPTDNPIFIIPYKKSRFSLLYLKTL